MTLDGHVVSPPSFWARAHALWRALPPGTIPALIAVIAVTVCAAIFLVSLLIFAIPVILALAVLGFILRASMGPPGSRPPMRR